MAARSRYCRWGPPTISPNRWASASQRWSLSPAGTSKSTWRFIRSRWQVPGDAAASSRGMGFGAIEQAIGRLPSKTTFSRARTKYAEAAMNAPAEDLKIRIDDEALSGSFAVLEVTKFPFVGPNLHLAPEIDIGDPTFSICSIGGGVRERQKMAKWLTEPNATPAPVTVRQARRLEIAGRFRQVRIEGQLWQGDKDGKKSNGTQIVVLESEPEPLFFLVPG